MRKNLKYNGNLYHSRYCQLSYLELEKKKNTQESDDEFWARLDKRIEWARARHELACLGMGTILLVIYMYVCMYV